MCRLITSLVVALLVSFSTMASAGGAQCEKNAKASHAHATVKEKAKHGWLGLKLDKGAAGYVVSGVEAGSPAETAGFQKGDVLVALNGVALDDAHKEALKAAKAKLGVGSQVTYTVSRAGAQRQVTATLAEVPPHVLAQWEKEYEKSATVAQSGN